MTGWREKPAFTFLWEHRALHDTYLARATAPVVCTTAYFHAGTGSPNVFHADVDHGTLTGTTVGSLLVGPRPTKSFDPLKACRIVLRQLDCGTVYEAPREIIDTHKTWSTLRPQTNRTYIHVVDCARRRHSRNRSAPKTHQHEKPFPSSSAGQILRRVQQIPSGLFYPWPADRCYFDVTVL